MYNKRQDDILEMINDKGSITLSSLEEVFNDVASITLRRDLILFEKDGHIIRTKGGAISTDKVSAISKDEPLYSFRELENLEAKKTIAKKALKYVEKGRSIYIDSGSTLMCLARIMSDEHYTVITSGLNIAIELLKKPNPIVVTLAGQINRNTISVSGPHAIDYLKNINIDIAFMSTSGYSDENGFTVSNIYESELKRTVIKKAKKTILLMDNSKFDKVLAFTFADKNDIDLVITERDDTI